MKKGLRIISLLAAAAILPAPGPARLSAQQIPVFQSYLLNPKLVNPAAQGGASGGGVSLAYRSQFSELEKSVRPVSYLLNADVSPLFGEESRIGLGLLVVQDNVHLLKRSAASLMFAYHLLPTDGAFQLSLGASAGFASHRLSLGDAPVNDPNDLALLRNHEAQTRFDGGPGLQARFLQGENGSGLRLDLALPQLFTSELQIKADDAPAGGRSTLRYGLLPHLYSSLAYRWQGSSFAVEPVLGFRESFGKPLKAGNLDLGLRLWLLEGNRLLLGGHFRTDEGGPGFLFGFRQDRFMLTGGYEMHAQLGNSLEIGLRYIWGGREIAPCRSGPAEQNLETNKVAAETARRTAGVQATVARDKMAFARSYLNDARNATGDADQRLKLEKTDQFLTQAEEAFAKVKAENRKLTTIQDETGKLIAQARNAKRKLCNETEAESIRLAQNEARNAESDIAAKLAELKTGRAAIKPLLDIQSPASIEKYLGERLAQFAGRPDGLKLVRVTADAIEFQYPDAEEVYNLDTDLPRVKAFADFLDTELAVLKAKGLALENARLAAALRYRDTEVRTDARYAAEFGDPLKTTYKLNDKAKTSSIANKAKLTVENLALLKTFSLKRHLAARLGLAEEKISIEISAPNAQEVQQLTRVTVQYKKI